MWAKFHILLLVGVAFSQLVSAQSMSFETTRINGITLSEDDEPREFTFAFKNVGYEPLVITRIDTSCNCTVASYDHRPIPAGKGGEIKLLFDPRGNAGRLARTVLVYTSFSMVIPAARLELNGEVAPAKDRWKARYPVLLGGSGKAIGATGVTAGRTGVAGTTGATGVAAGGTSTEGGMLRAKRNSVSFGTVSGSQTRREERIECVNIGDRPVSLSTMKGMVPKWLSIRTEPETIAPGEVADIVIIVDGEKLHTAKTAGEISQIVVLESLGGRPSERTLYVSVEVGGM